MILFILGPLVMSFIMSFYDWPVIGERVFVGIGNYVELFTKDDQFYKSLYITFKFTLFFVPFNIIIALILAVLISKNLKFISVFRVIFYLPTVVSSVAVSIIWGWILNTEFGILNYGLSVFDVLGK